jgi:hypothetical protein
MWNQVTLTFNEFAQKLKNGATIRFEVAQANEFIEWFTYYDLNKHYNLITEITDNKKSIKINF